MDASRSRSIDRDGVTGTTQTAQEGVIGILGPHREHATGLECAGAPIESARSVESIVAALTRRVRTFVEIEEDRIVRVAGDLADHARDIAGDHGRARVGDGVVGEDRQRTATPLFDLGDELGDVDASIGRQRIERGTQRVRHTESADQNAWRRADERACEHREALFGRALVARHQDPPGDHEKKFLVAALAQLERTLVGDCGRERLPRLHRRACYLLAVKLVVVVALLIGCQQGSGPAPTKSDVIGPAPKRTVVTPPFDVPAPADPVIAIGRGLQHACVVRASGGVDCWGQPRSCTRCAVPAPPDGRVRRLPEISDAIAISPGARCFVRRTGEVECLDAETGKLAPVVGLDHVRAATDDGCYLLDNGGVRCVDDAGVQRPVEAVHDAIQMAATHRAVCIVRKDRTLACGTRFGPLVKVVKVDQVRALVVTGDDDPTVCVLAAQSRCFTLDVDTERAPLEPVADDLIALDPRATQLAIGLTGYGERYVLHYEIDALVDGKVVTTGKTTTTTIPVLGDAKLLAFGCVVRATGAVACWGDNRGAVLAQPTTIGRVDVPPTPVPGITNVASVAAGATETWALTRDGRALHWGDIGDGVVREPTEIVFAGDVFGTEKLVELVATPSGIGCARGELGHVWCQFARRHQRTIVRLQTQRVTHLSIRGFDVAVLDHADGSQEVSAELRGPPDEVVRKVPPEGKPPRLPVTNATMIATGDSESCAIVEGHVMCWGDKLEARAVDGITTATVLVMASDYGCAIDSGRVVCWHFTKDSAPIQPTQVIGSGAISLALGSGYRAQWLDAHTIDDGPRPGGEYGCAVMIDHTVQCWGANILGELLDSSFRSTVTPIGIRLD